MPLLSPPAGPIPNVQQSWAFYEAISEVIVPRESSQLEWLFTKLIKNLVRQNRMVIMAYNIGQLFICLSTVCIYFGEGVCLNIFPTFYLSCLFSYCWALRVFFGIFCLQVFFIRYVFSKYLLPVCGLSSHSLYSSQREIFNFNKE